MYQLAADLEMWPLHSRRLIHVREGAFLQPPGAAAAAPNPVPQPAAAPSAAAAGPAWPQDSSLAAAASAIAAAVSSAVASGLGPLAEQLQAAGGPPRTATAGTAAQPAVAVDLGPAGRAFIEQHLPLLDVPWGIKLQLDAAGVSGLRVVTPAALRPLLRRLGQRGGGLAAGGGAFERMGVQAAVELLDFCCSDLTQAVAAVADGAAGASAAEPSERRLDGSGGGSGNRLHGYPSPPRAPSPAPALAAPTRHPGRVRDLLGLPMPTATGGVTLIGSTQLLIAPPAPPPDAVPAAASAAGGAAQPRHPVASGLLPASLGREFVHEAAVAALEGHLKDPALRRELKLQYYGVPQVAVHLRGVLGPEWVARDSESGGGGAASAAAQWDGASGAGPMRWWLREAWGVVLASAAGAAQWGADHAAGALEALDPLLLVPLSDGRLAKAALLGAALVADGGEDEGDAVVAAAGTGGQPSWVSGGQ
jgi:hypothetical protein